MKHLILIICLVVTVGCANGLQVDDTASHKAIAYAAGKAMGITITKIEPDLNEPLGEKWDKMMDKPASDGMMASEYILAFYSEALMVLGSHVGDKYGLIQDLSVLLVLFGAQYSEQGDLIAIEPVPVSVLEFFAMGYDSGVMVVAKGR